MLSYTNIFWYVAVHLYNSLFRSVAIKSTDVLREQLITATKEKNRGKLLAAIEECEDAEFLELSTYLRKAREALEMMGGGAGG